MTMSSSTIRFNNRLKSFCITCCRLIETDDVVTENETAYHLRLALDEYPTETGYQKSLDEPNALLFEQLPEPRCELPECCVHLAQIPVPCPPLQKQLESTLAGCGAISRNLSAAIPVSLEKAVPKNEPGDRSLGS